MQLDSVERFFKYSDVDGARFILRDGTLKFSTASSFNDPFDAAIESLFAYDPIEKLAELLREQEEILLSDKIHPPFASGQTNQLMRWMREVLSVKSKSEKETIRKLLTADSPESIWNLDRLRAVEKETLSEIKKIFSTDAIFCASLDPNNQLLWSHYAARHEGVALEFVPNVSCDSILRLMTKVNYSDVRPVLYSSPKDFLFKSFFKERQDIIREYAQSILYSKNKCWQYEQEVRVHIPGYAGGDETFRLHEYFPDELRAIYLGCKTETAVEIELVGLAHSKNKNVNVFKMEMGKSDYELSSNQKDIKQYL